MVPAQVLAWFLLHAAFGDKIRELGNLWPLVETFVEAAGRDVMTEDQGCSSWPCRVYLLINYNCGNSMGCS